MAPYDNASPSGSDSTREYILDMIRQLATMAEKMNEIEIASRLTAIRDAARAPKRDRLH